MENKIDFVILWVDGSDEAWLDERRKYSGDENTGSKSRIGTGTIFSTGSGVWRNLPLG